eukprot:687540-Hanusia_phi.AAC.1
MEQPGGAARARGSQADQSCALHRCVTVRMGGGSPERGRQRGSRRGRGGGDGEGGCRRGQEDCAAERMGQ